MTGLGQLTQFLNIARSQTLTQKIDAKARYAIIIAVAVGIALCRKRNKRTTPLSPRSPTNEKKRRQVRVDATFWKRLRRIISIVIPSAGSKEGLLLALLSTQLIARTLLSVVITELAGKNAQALVARDWPVFFRGVLMFFFISFPASLLNSSRKYVQGLLSLNFRLRLSQHVNDEYLKGVNFYKAINFGGDRKIDNPDQRVTADIHKFCDAIAELYVETFKPMFDVFLFTYQLSRILGWQGPAAMYAYFFLSGFIKKNLMPSFGRLVAKESALEGQYRTAQNRLIINAEEIAFYDGSTKERGIIERALTQIQVHTAAVRFKKFLVGVVDQLLVKYWASIAGYMVVTMPFLLDLPHVRGHTVEMVTKDYILNSQYLTRLAQAVGDVIMVGNKLTTIAGYTHRVWELMEMIQHLNSEKGNRPFEVKEDATLAEEHRSDDDEEVVSYDMQRWLGVWKRKCDQQKAERFKIRHDSQRDTNHVIGGGQVVESEIIKLEHVDIVSPEGTALVKDLCMEVKPGMNVMVTGPNGCGKSSLFRVIGELWPLQSGTLYKPKREDVLFVPQKPYLVLGSLRDQIIYPHSVTDMKALGITDDDLKHLLDTVDPARKIVSTWGWDDVRDWFTAFSGGQKQRVAMARLFYHKPSFAILDECTSAVSVEVEDAIYQTAKDLGITIFTVSHRAALKRHHDFVLTLDGRGNWTFAPVNHSDVSSLHNAFAS